MQIDQRDEARERVDAVLATMPEARRVIGREFWPLPRPEELQVILKLVGDSDVEGPRKEIPRTLLALRLIADRETKSFWDISLVDATEIRHRAKTLGKILESLDALDDLLKPAFGSARSEVKHEDREFLQHATRILSPRRDLLEAAVTVAPRLADVLESIPVDEAEIRSQIPSLTVEEARLMTAPPGSSSELAGSARRTCLEAAVVRWMIHEDVAAWESLWPPAPDVQTAVDSDARTAVDSDARAAVDTEATAAVNPHTQAAVDVEAWAAAVADARAAVDVDAQAAIDPGGQTAFDLDARWALSGAETAKDGTDAGPGENAAVARRTENAHADGWRHDAATPRTAVGPQAEPRTARERTEEETAAQRARGERRDEVRGHAEEHQVVYSLVIERLQGLLDEAMQSRQRETAEWLTRFRHSLVASYSQLSPILKNQAPGSASDLLAGLKEKETGEPASPETVEKVLEKAAQNLQHEAAATSADTPVRLDKKRRRARIAVMAGALVLLSAIAVIVHIGLPEGPPTPIDFSPADSRNVLSLIDTHSIGTMLYARVPDRWVSLPDGERLRQLTSLSRLSAERGFAEIYLVDEGGEPVAQWDRSQGARLLTASPP